MRDDESKWVRTLSELAVTRRNPALTGVVPGGTIVRWTRAREKITGCSAPSGSRTMMNLRMGSEDSRGGAEIAEEDSREDAKTPRAA